MHLAQIWRYPVKSLGGEPMTAAAVRSDGIEGDRLVQVRHRRHELVTSRTRPRLLGLRGSLGADGTPLVDGRPWHDDASRQAIREAVGPDAELVFDDRVSRFDILPLLVATDGAIEAFGRDGRRLRPNLVIGGVDGLAERGWEGRAVRIGPVVIGLHSLRGRCVMTTFDPDTQAQDVEVLRDINRRFDGTLALNAFVIEPGTVRVGDRVSLLADR